MYLNFSTTLIGSVCLSHTGIPPDIGMVLFGDFIMEFHTFRFGLIFISLTITAMYSMASGVGCLFMVVCWRLTKALQTSLLFTKNAPMTCPSQCICKARTGVVVMVVLLLLSATTVNLSLLLRSGDVEQNPGPSYLDGKIIVQNFFCLEWKECGIFMYSVPPLPPRNHVINVGGLTVEAYASHLGGQAPPHTFPNWSHPLRAYALQKC